MPKTLTAPRNGKRNRSCSVVRPIGCCRTGTGVASGIARIPAGRGRYARRMLRYLTAGESHGQALVVIVEGLPAGLPITVEEIQGELGRRRLGFGRGPRMRFEVDELTLVGGVRHGRTLGSPVAIEIKNTEWFRSDKWHAEMSPAPGATTQPLTQVRPGHADLAGMQKYGFDDARDVLERASARETAARCAAGSLAKKLLAAIGVDVLSHVIQMGGARSKAAERPTPGDLPRVDESPVRCYDKAAEDAMVAEIEAAAKVGDSLGGIVEVLAYGVPVGLGSHVHWDRKLDALLAQAVMSIQAVKGVEIGDGFEVAARRGSEAHDPIVWDGPAGAYRRESSLAGGTEGGISTGELLVVRAAMKPLATLNRPTLKTVDTLTKEQTVSFKERTDVTAVPAMGVVGETMVALVLAAEAQRKFGGDSLAEFVRNAESFRAGL
jgi:chorismate synthase